jgi:phospholipid/cholesterol/gamma-HCH transport system substrate-binding protein
MEIKANYLLVGLSCIILLLVGAVSALWLANVRFAGHSDPYNIVFDGAVDGLIPGADVRFDGVKVGEVTGLDIDPTNTGRVIVRTTVRSDAPVRRDSVATLESAGFTGNSYIQISPGPPGSPLLRAGVGFGRTPTLVGRSDRIANLYQGGAKAISLAIDVLSHADRALSDQNVDAITASLADVHGFAGALNEHRAVVADADKAVRDADTAMLQFQGIERTGQSLLDGDGRRVLKNLAAASLEAKGAAQELHGLASRVSGPAGDFATNGLPQITAAAVDLQKTSETLDRLLKEVEANPREFINKPASPQLEVHP